MRYEIILWWMALLKSIPGKLGCWVRRNCLPSRLAKNTMIWDNVHIDSPKSLSVGCNSSINRGCVLNCGGGIQIGDNALIGPNVVIYSQNHVFVDLEVLIKNQGYIKEKVIIEDDCWIAAGVTILPGVTISQGSVVGAGSVVTKSTTPYSVNLGVPSCFIKKRDIL